MWGILTALLSGALMSIQGVFNTEVTKQTSTWLAAGWVQISAFAVCLAAWCFTGRQSFGGLWTVRPWYMLLGGAPLALTYKAINTMDSMVGYKNERYLRFGRAAAKLDDIANYLPSRIAALLWVAAAALTGNDARSAWRIWRRDRRNHASPNSAQTESACAGALNVQLAGPAYYFGQYYPKPTIGDAVRPIEPEDIRRADRMMYAESLLALALGLVIRGIL